jgi:hypothetical protein
VRRNYRFAIWASAILVLVSFARAGQAGQPSIYNYDLPVIDITGYKAKIVVNYRDKNSSAPADHSGGDASPAIGAIGLLVSDANPLSKSFEKIWNGKKDKNGQTMRERALARAVKEIASNGGLNITGGFPERGQLLAVMPPVLGDPLILTYWLPNASFLFYTEPSLGPKELKTLVAEAWSLTFDTELYIAVPLQAWPNVPAPTAFVNLSSANISAANGNATLEEALGEIAAFFSSSNSGLFGDDWPVNLFQSQEGSIDGTVGSLNITSVGQLLDSLGKQAYYSGFRKCGAFVGATKADTPEGRPTGTPAPTLNIRLVHPVDPGPTLVNTAERTGPQLLRPVISPSQTQVPAGGQLVLTGNYFPAAQADAIYLGWNDTVSGTLMGSEIQWSEPGQPKKHAEISRKQFSPAGFTITGLHADTPYKVQVRDSDLLTYTDWSAPITIKTHANNSVDLLLKTSSASVSLGTATRDASGNFKKNVTVPAGTSSGEHTITATDGSDSASITVQVLGAGESPNPKLFVIDSATRAIMDAPVSMAPGATFKLHGEGFKQGTVTLAIQGGKSIGDAKVGADSTFGVNVSPSVESGAYTIVASQGTGPAQLQATLGFYVLPPPK